MALAVGDVVPDLPLVTRAGERTSLHAFRGEATLLIFLRHLGWLPCREHLVQVSERREELAGRVACITFAAPSLLAAFERELGLEIPLFGDPERVTYEAFGFGRGSVRRVWLDPRVWASYARLLARGRRMHRAREDTLQLGGDVVLDARLALRWIHRSRGPEDRPGVDELIAALAEAARG